MAGSCADLDCATAVPTPPRAKQNGPCNLELAFSASSGRPPPLGRTARRVLHPTDDRLCRARKQYQGSIPANAILCTVAYRMAFGARLPSSSGRIYGAVGLE
jgi:hypothetical protein